MAGAETDDPVFTMPITPSLRIIVRYPPGPEPEQVSVTWEGEVPDWPIVLRVLELLTAAPNPGFAGRAGTAHVALSR